MQLTYLDYLYIFKLYLKGITIMKNINYEFPKVWNEISYNNFVKFLFTLKDDKYKNFHNSLVLNSKYEMIGIRVPIMREIAKEIAKTNIEEYLKCVKNNYYEETLIEGLVISHIKDEKLFYDYFNIFINKIDNWAICDSFCSSIKIVRKYEDKYFEESVKLALNESEFISRVGLVTILNHFVTEKRINEIINLLNKIKSDKFYINMAEAWLICDMYIKFPKETKAFLKDNNLNKFTQNKAISKIHDSFRITDKDKEELKKYRK